MALVLLDKVKVIAVRAGPADRGESDLEEFTIFSEKELAVFCRLVGGRHFYSPPHPRKYPGLNQFGNDFLERPFIAKIDVHVVATK